MLHYNARILTQRDLNWVQYLVYSIFLFKHRHFSDAHGDKPETRFLLLGSFNLLFTVFSFLCHIYFYIIIGVACEQDHFVWGIERVIWRQIRQRARRMGRGKHCFRSPQMENIPFPSRVISRAPLVGVSTFKAISKQSYDSAFVLNLL